MSQDPNAGYGSDPENPYANTPPLNPNNNPYGQPSQPPYGQPSSENPYGQSSQPPYGQPSSENPYGQPVGPYGQPPYGQQPPYGAPQGPGYPNYGPPPMAASNPLPLGEAIRQLPNQYIKILTKPSAQTFAEEMGKSSWDIVWIQLLGYAVIGAILTYLSVLISPNRYNFTGANSSAALPPATLQAITLGSSIGSIILIPLFFFIGVGIIYLIAKAFRGSGTFLRQSYTSLLVSVPVGILSLLLGLIPIIGSIAGAVLSIYAIVLHIFSIMAVHRLSGGKATLVVLLPVIVGLLLACGLVIFFVVVLAAAMRH